MFPSDEPTTRPHATPTLVRAAHANAAEAVAEADPEADAASTERARVLLRLTGLTLFPLFVALGARVAIPIEPFGIPFTLQTLAVVLAAVCMGPRLGAASMLLYIVMGIVGVPLFAEGSAGWQVILGQTGGYLVGFVLCQPAMTAIIKRPDGTIRGWGAMIAAVTAGHAVIFALGVPWLWFVRSTDPDAAITWAQALQGGLVVFLPGMVIKTAVAVWIGKIAAPWASRNIW